MNTTETLRRIMELQAKPELNQAERAELHRLDTAWHNHWMSPSEAPVRKLVGDVEHQP